MRSRSDERVIKSNNIDTGIRENYNGDIYISPKEFFTHEKTQMAISKLKNLVFMNDWS